MTIPSLPNKDWRNSSRSTKTQVSANSIYLPPGAQQSLSNEPIITVEVNTGGGSGRGGIIRSEKTDKVEESTAAGAEVAGEAEPVVPRKEETLDERAMRALLAGANGENEDGDDEDVEAIQGLENKRQVPISEEEAFRRDVDSRPEEVRLSSFSVFSLPLKPGSVHLDHLLRHPDPLSSRPLPHQSNASDYARIPVANFGMALLKGMGWKEGQAASRHRKGLEQPYVPAARPSLLGIGAKERAAPELGKGEKAKPKWKLKEEAKKYVPIMKVERNGSASGSGAGVSLSRIILGIEASRGRREDELTRSCSTFVQTPTALSRPSTPSSSSAPTPHRRTSRSASPPRRRHDDSSSRRDRDDREPSSSSSRYRDRDDRESSSSSRRDDRESSSRRDDRRDRDRDSRPKERSRSRERERRRESRRDEETEEERRERKRREKERERDRDGGGERRRDDGEREREKRR